MEPEDALFREPLSGFVTARDALVATLRAAGDREGAARVKAIRKPSVPAWAVNQLSFHHREQLEALFEIGRDLRAAQRELLAGASGSEPTKELAAKEREAVHALVVRAAELLGDTGIEATAAYREKIADTLYATASDDGVREAVARGRLIKEARRVGFGTDPGLQVIAGSPPAPDPEARAREERARHRARLEQKVALLETEAAQADRAVTDAERAHEETARALARARKAAAASAERLEAARAALDDHTDTNDDTDTDTDTEGS